MDIVLDILENLLADINRDILNSSGSLLWAAKAIAGIGFLITFYFHGYKQLLAERYDWMTLGPPIAIILGIAFYGTFINTANLVLNTVSSSIKKELNLADDRFYNRLDDYEQDDLAHIDQRKEDKLNQIYQKVNPVGVILPGSSIITNLMSSSSLSLKDIISNFFFDMLKNLARVAIMILLIIRGFFLIVLSLFGIFAIAFSMYPPLRGSFATWLQKFINVHLWLPIAYILEIILVKAYDINSMSTAVQETAGSNLLLLMICFSAIIGFAFVPTLSSWFITAATVTAASKLKNKSTAAGKAAKAVATKGTSLVKPKKKATK